jgi:hypothetical protein
MRLDAIRWTAALVAVSCRFGAAATPEPRSRRHLDREHQQRGFLGARYLHDGSSAANPGTRAAWKPSFPVAGAYNGALAGARQSPGRDPYRIYHQGGVSEVVRDQRSQNGSWVYLGRYLFAAGSSDAGRVTLDAGSDGGVAIADAARSSAIRSQASRRPG